jgi:hypothetical protein
VCLIRVKNIMGIMYTKFVYLWNRKRWFDPTSRGVHVNKLDICELSYQVIRYNLDRGEWKNK